MSCSCDCKSLDSCCPSEFLYFNPISLKISTKLLSLFFTITTGNQLSRIFRKVENPDMGNYENLNRSGLEWLGRVLTRQLITSPEYLRIFMSLKSLSLSKNIISGRTFPNNLHISRSNLGSESRNFLRASQQGFNFAPGISYDLHRSANAKVIETWHVTSLLIEHRQAKSAVMQLLAINNNHLLG